MRIFKTATVFDEALDRIRWLFHEFPNIVVAVSGGKDSTVIFHLTLQVARELNRLPLRVMWIDQEAEWQSTVDTVRSQMYHPDVEPFWFQVPMKLFNATSTVDHWLQCWDPAARDLWMHPQDPCAITENRYGTDRFVKLIHATVAKEFKTQKTCIIGGVRAEESPFRRVGLIHYPSYKWATWGAVRDKKLQHFTMYPLYDWLYSDVWKAILDNGWPYNAVYDAQYRYGINVRDMRVSNVHHETAITNLFYMPEVEPETWNRLTARLAGIDMAGKLGKADYLPETLPPMFASWMEYRDYLLEKLIDNPEWRAGFRKWFKLLDVYAPFEGDKLHKASIRGILLNDWEGVTLNNYWTILRLKHLRQVTKENADARLLSTVPGPSRAECDREGMELRR